MGLVTLIVKDIIRYYFEENILETDVKLGNTGPRHEISNNVVF